MSLCHTCRVRHKICPSKITNEISADIGIDIPPVPHSVVYSVVFIQEDASAEIQYGEYAGFAAR